MNQPDPTGMGTYLSTWAGGCSTTAIDGKLTNIESYLDSLVDKIVKPIQATIATSLPVIQNVHNTISESIDTRLLAIETNLVNVETRLQDNVLTALEPIYVATNQLIGQLVNIGYEPAGPIRLRPLLPESGIADESSFVPPVVEPGQKPGKQTTSLSPTIATGQSARGGPGPQSTTIGTSPGQNTTAVSSLMVNGGLAETAKPTTAMPFWIINPPGGYDPTGTMVVSSAIQPVVLTGKVYGPFFEVVSLGEVVRQLQSGIHNQTDVVSRLQTGSGGQCPIIITVNCPSPGPIVDSIQTVTGQDGETTTTTTEGDVVSGSEDDNLEYIEWLETEDGLRAIDVMLANVGLSKEQVASLPILKQDANYYINLMSNRIH